MIKPIKTIIISNRKTGDLIDILYATTEAELNDKLETADRYYGYDCTIKIEESIL